MSTVFLNFCIVGLVLTVIKGFNNVVWGQQSVHDQGQASLILEKIDLGKISSNTVIPYLSWLPSFFKKDLMLIPLVSEPILWELVQKMQWTSVIEYSKLIHKEGQMSFRIWYYKALAECALLQIDQCRVSWSQASQIISQSNLFHRNIVAMKRYLDIFQQNQRPSSSVSFL